MTRNEHAMEIVSLHKEPELRNPYLIAGLPSPGGVAMIAARYLKDSLGAEELAAIQPYEFFEPGRVALRDNIIGEPEFPESKFYFWKSGKENDLLIFIAEAEPAAKGYRFANLVLDVAQRFGVKRVYALATIPTHIYFTKKPKVLGSTTSPELIWELHEYGVSPISSGSISGINGLLLGAARKRELDAICLSGEIPIYMTNMPSPRTSKAILEVLTHMLGIQIDMAVLDNRVKEAEEEIEKDLFRLMRSPTERAKRVLDYFQRLREQAEAEEVEQLPEYSEELLREVEQFLERERGEKEDY